MTPSDDVLNLTKILLFAGSKGMTPSVDAKTENVGVAPESICVLTDEDGGDLHCALAGFVSQMERVNGRFTIPVSACAVIVALAPTFDVAIENAAAPLTGIFKMPSLLGVAANAIISGTGVDEAINSRVLTPDKIGAGSVLSQSNENFTSVAN